MKQLIFILLLQGTFMTAQVSGYMGKRFSVGYSNYFSPAFVGRTANSTEMSLGVNTVHCVNLEYSIKRRTNFCIGIQFWKTGIIRENGYDYSYEYNDPYGGITSESGTAYYLPDTRAPMQLRTVNISMGFKFFRHGYIAPVGRYTKLEGILFMDNVSYDPLAFYRTSSGFPKDRFSRFIGTGYYSYKTFAVALTLGRQRVLFNRIIIDSGIRFGVSPNFVFNYIVNDVFGDTYRKSMEDQIKLNTNTRIFTGQLVNLHLGIGFLAF